MNECKFVMQICCYNKCGVALEELNPHLPFGDHLLGHFFYFFTGIRGFYTFFVVYTIDESVQKMWFNFQFKFKGVC
jgi:hypothetical protein